MFEYFIGGKKLVVVGETYKPNLYGTGVREYLRARLSLLTNDSTEIGEAAHLGASYIGNEHLQPSTLLERARERFRIASQPFPRGDKLGIDG